MLGERFLRMYKHWIWGGILSLLLTFFAVPALYASVDADLETWAKSYFRSAVEDRRAVGAVIVVVDSAGPLYVDGFGYGDLEAREPIHPVVTYIPIGDIGNLFTFNEIYRLDRERRLSLDEPVNTFLTRVQLDPTYSGTTIRDLLQNRSGFTTSPRGSLVRRGSSTPPAIRFAKRLGAKKASFNSEIPQYSTYAAAVATIMVEDLTGEPVDARLSRFFREELDVQPYFNTLDNAPPEYILQHYNVSKFGERTRQELYAAAPGFLAAKGVHLTPTDVGKLAVRLLSELTVDPGTGSPEDNVASRLSYEPRNYQTLAAAGTDAFGISGHVQSATTDLVLIPELDIGVFVMVSGERKSPDLNLGNNQNTVPVPLTARQAAQDLIQRLGEAPASVAEQLSPKIIRKLAGVYAGIALPDNTREDFFNIDKQMANVRVEGDGQLLINEQGPFHPVNETTFMDVNGTVATFHMSKEGKVEALTFANHKITKLVDPNLPVKILAGFGVALLAGLVLLSAPLWMGHSIKESLAIWAGTLAAGVMVVTVALPAWQYFQGWPSSFVDHSFFPIWTAILWTFAGLTLLTIVFCILAWKGRYWALDGQGLRRRSRFTIGTLGLTCVVFLYAQLGLLPIAAG